MLSSYDEQKKHIRRRELEAEKNDTMDLISEAQRLKEYYDGLDQIAHHGVPQSLTSEIEADLCDPVADYQYRRTMSLWLHVYIPFYQVFSFIANNRILHEELPLYIEEIPAYGIAYSAETIFRHLKTLIPAASGELIRTIGGSGALHDQLHQALLAGQEGTFCQLVHDRDLHTISFLCSQLMDDISVVLSLDEDQIGLALDVSLKSSMAIIGDEYDELSLAAWEFDKAVRQLRDNDTDQNFTHYMKTFYDYLFRHLLCLVESYWTHANRYMARETAILDGILKREEAQPVVIEAEAALQQYMDDSQSESLSSQTSTTARSRKHSGIGFKSQDQHFQLGSNYFAQGMAPAGSKDYFYCHEEVLRGGPDKLTALINYLADHDYIPHDTFVKRAFAYRLTGKGAANDVSPIPWNGRNGNPYELIYLVRHLTVRGDYRKMRRFFVGPQWVKDRDSSYAKSANYDFKKFLHDLYPAICPL